MITEDYVSFETAKLLKEKDFNEDCLKYYIEGRKYIRDLSDEDGPHRLKNSKANENVVTVPTLQMAMKWLREVHNIQIQIAPINSKYKDWTFGIYKDFSPLTIELICCPTYKEACEAAIKYCLENLI